jgi:anti-sigma B factor antagonist
MNSLMNDAFAARLKSCYMRPKESKVRLRLEVHECDGVTLVHCTGRITYRNEAASLSKTVIGLLPGARCLVLDLGGVECIDSAGLGDLVVLYMRTRASDCSFKLASPRKEILELLQLTNLTSLLEVFPSVGEALLATAHPAA